MRVDLETIPFNPRVAYLHTLESYRSAALRLGVTYRHTTARVAYGKRNVRPPMLEDIVGLVRTLRTGRDVTLIVTAGRLELTDAFQGEIDRATLAARGNRA